MEIKGKIFNFLGDSITEGACIEPEDAFHQVLKVNEGLKEARNYGIGGTRIARQKETCIRNGEPVTRWDLDFVLREKEMKRDADVVVVFGGTNDFGHGDAKFGTMADRDVYSYYGALHTLIINLLTDFPDAKIVFMTPLHRVDEAAHDGKPALKAYVDAMKEVCEYYAIPVLDLFATSGIQPQLPIIFERYTADGLHPNAKGHRLIAERIAGFLKSL